MFVCQLLTSAKKAKQQRQNERCSIEHLSLSFSGLLNPNRKQESEPKKNKTEVLNRLFIIIIFLRARRRV